MFGFIVIGFFNDQHNGESNYLFADELKNTFPTENREKHLFFSIICILTHQVKSGTKVGLKNLRCKGKTSHIHENNTSFTVNFNALSC